MKGIKDNLGSILTLTGGRDGPSEKPEAAVTKYLQQISSLTSPQTPEDMKDINQQAQADELNTTIVLLRKRLEEKVKFATVLEQGLRSRQASTDVIQSQLDQTCQAREQTQKEQKDVAESTRTLGEAIITLGKKQVDISRESNRLELQIKDLQMTHELTVDKEKKAEMMHIEADEKGHRLEQDLISVRIENTRLLEDNDKMQNDLLQTEDSLQEKRDIHVRGSNASKVRVIAFRKKFEETVDVMEETRTSLDELNDSLGRLRETIRMEGLLEGAAINELQARLNGEEAANKQLCKTLGQKEKTAVMLATNLKTATAAREMLSQQLEERLTLSMELSKRLTDLNMHTQTLEERLGDKSVEAENLSKALEAVQSDVKVLELQLSKEKHNVLSAGRTLENQQTRVTLGNRSVSEKVDADQTMTLRVKQIEADAGLLRGELDDAMTSEQKIKMRLSVTEQKRLILGQQFEDLDLTFKEMTDRHNKCCQEHDRVEHNLKHKTKQLMKDEHDSKIRLNDLQNELRARYDTVVQLKNGLMLNDVKIRDLTEMLENASVSAEQNRQLLAKRTTEVGQANKLLESEIAQEKSRGALLEQDLLNVEGRLRSSLAQLKAQESTAEGIEGVNDTDQDMIMKRLTQQTQKMERINTERRQVLSDSRAWQIKLEDQVHDKNRAMKMLTDEKVITNKQRDRMEEAIDRELEQKSRIKMLEKHNTALDEDLESKTEMCSKVSIDGKDLEGECDIVHENLRSQELQNKDLLHIQDNNRKKHADCQEAFKQQESNHLADARAVKMSIVTLQDSLMERISMVEQLVRTTTKLKAKTAELKTQVESTEFKANSSRKQFETQLSEEQQLCAAMRGKAECKVREKQQLLDGIQAKSDKIIMLERTLIESGNKGEVLKSDVDTKRKESEMMADQLAKREFMERSMFQSLMDKEDNIVRMKRETRERLKRTSTAEKNVKAAMFENRLLKKQLQEKAKAERYLLAELEGLRLHVHENTNPMSMKGAMQQMKADKEFQRVLTNSVRT